MFEGSSSCNDNLSLEGFILFLASSYYYVISSNRSKPRRNEKYSINVLKKYAPQKTADKFPWEAEIKPVFVNPFMNNSPSNGPLLCTFITHNDDERSSEEKMKAVAVMACYRGHFNVACICCK